MAYLTTCVRVEAGAVFCWGENRFGEFGNGTLLPSPIPVAAALGPRLVQLFGSRGTTQMCGLDGDARAYCWGYNVNGEIGDGTTASRLTPTPVAGDHRFSMVSTAFHTCALDLAGQAFCWGASSGGQLGDDGAPGEALAPRPVATTSRYAAITNGGGFTCALRNGGEVDCWGWGVGMGSGPGDRSVPRPSPVSGNRQYSRISAGYQWACALTLTGSPYCWGKAGPLPQELREAPEAVPTELVFREITSGSGYGACALTTAGDAYCWHGREKPLALPGGHRWAGLDGSDSGNNGYCGYTPGGSGFCWHWAQRQANGVTEWSLTEPVPIPSLPQ